LLIASTIAQAQDIPTLGNSSSNLVSIDQERKLGKAWLRSLRQHTRPYENSLVEEYFSDLVYSLAPYSNVIDRNFSLIVINSPDLNAFAVPGSIIGINAGLFFSAINEQEFASVIAHELAHLGQRHYARQLEQQRISTPLTLAGVLASVIVAATTGSDAGMVALASTQALSADQQLRFSRKNEQEADRIGIKTLFNSRFDPKAMPTMFERLYKKNRAKGDEQRLEYLSTHPLTESRISDTRNRATQFPVKQYRDNIEFHFSKNMVISDFSTSKYDAIKHFEAIINKGNSAQILAAQFGLAYASLKTDPKLSMKILDELLIRFPYKISLKIVYAKALHENKQSKLAMSTLEDLLSRNPENYSISDALAELYMQNDLIEESEKLLIKMIRTQPENPRIWYLLAEANGLAGHIVDLHQSRAEFFFLSNQFDKALDQLRLALQKIKTNEQKTASIHERMNEINELKENPAF